MSYSQYLKNPYQVTIMSQSESMSLHEKSQDHPLPASLNDPLSEPDDPLEASYTSEEGAEEEEKEQEAYSADSSSQKGVKEKSRKKESKEGYTVQFEAFKKAFDEQADVEAKLQLALHFMEASLAQGGTPHFRSFWEARRLCLPLFKENIPPVLRHQLWTKYSDLSKEARRLKEILDEQSAFAVEQIEIAIRALEKEISEFDVQVEKASLPESLSFPQALKHQQSIYQQLQKQLNILNVQASRINALRKELLRTEMRIRQKNKFFQQLSAAGDQVFPRRKELIKQISHQFIEDVDGFITLHFMAEASHESLYVLREEIKAFQGLAKLLTLNTHAFTQTRTRLSECWDRIKVEERDRKRERAQQRVLFRQNAEEMGREIQGLKEAFEKNEASVAEVQKGIEAIASRMRKVELGRDEVKHLREALGEVRKLIQERVRAEGEERQRQEYERIRQKKERYEAFKEQAEQLLQGQEAQEIEKLIADRDHLLVQLHESSLTKGEKQEIERLLKPLRDIITERKERALLALSEDDRQALQQLQSILRQRQERRQEVKNHLKVLRKGAASSSLDFEKAMNYTAQIHEEEVRLEKANQGIQEIEDKIKELQFKIKG